MFEAIANFALMIIGIAVAAIWIVSLTKWDGKGCEPNKNDCDHCPFPCEQHKK